MNIEFRTRETTELNIDSEARQDVARRLRCALAPFAQRVVRVVVRLKAGRRNTVLCAIRVSGTPGWRVVLRDQGDSVEEAASAAIARIPRAVSRRIEVTLRRHQRLRAPAPRGSVTAAKS